MMLVIIIISICVKIVSGKAEREQASPVQGHFYLQASEGETIRMMQTVCLRSHGSFQIHCRSNTAQMRQNIPA